MKKAFRLLGSGIFSAVLMFTAVAVPAVAINSSVLEKPVAAKKAAVNPAAPGGGVLPGAKDPLCEGATGSQAAECGLSQVSDDDRDLMSIVKTILNTVFMVIGIVCTIVIILGGISFITSRGDPNKTAKAKNTILYAVIGLVIVLLSFVITNFVLGVFDE